MVFPAIVDRETTLKIAGDGFAQFDGAEVGGLMRAAVFKTGDRSAGNVPRGVEVRLAHAKGNNALGLGDEVEKFPNAALRQRRDVRSDPAFLS